MKPAWKCFRRSQRSKISKGFHERILNGVFRQVAVAKNRKCTAEC